MIRMYEAPEASPCTRPDVAAEGVRKFSNIAAPHTIATTFTTLPQPPREKGALVFGHPLARARMNARFPSR